MNLKRVFPDSIQLTDKAYFYICYKSVKMVNQFYTISFNWPHLTVVESQAIFMREKEDFKMS